MDLPQFEEKQYEGALTHELVAGRPTAYPSGQVLEALVGYDVALHPGDSKIWDLLASGFPPGVVLSSGLWSGAPRVPPRGDLPRDVVSLVLQMKRPQHLDHWRAGQDHHWRGPYYRFHIEDRQQTQLAALERGVGRRALVRYAAPAFLQLRELYDHQRNRLVAEHSSFVSPRVLSGHRLWSYAQAGTAGYVNPEGAEAESDTHQTMVAQAAESTTRESLIDHVHTLAELGEAELGSDEWIGQVVPPEGTLSAERLSAVLAWAAFAQLVASQRAEWLILDFAE